MPASEAKAYHTERVVLIYTTFPSPTVAEAIAADLLERRLIACANILGGMVSIYAWQGVRHRDDETVMILKTRASLIDAVTAGVRAGHPYDNPAIVAFETAGGSVPFLDWVLGETVAAAPSGTKQQ